MVKNYDKSIEIDQNSNLVNELIPFLAPLDGLNIIWIFNNLRVSTF